MAGLAGKIPGLTLGLGDATVALRGIKSIAEVQSNTAFAP